ncbi:hypothetical protein BJV77DRAFT_481358 [Russula vinacea]|nr:hypothetical protein BJV77DRAFT_481358 [Russula vinacea]
MQLLLSGRGVILVICSAVDGKIQGTGPLHRYGQAPAAVQTVTLQTGKLTFQIQLGVYRIEWRLSVCDVRKTSMVAGDWCGQLQIGFQYFALYFSDKAINDPNVNTDKRLLLTN